MTDIERINALTTNARNTWFVLLAALVFVGIALMSIEHIDFYGVDRATTLPLVNVEVPTRAFFVAAPLLIAAIYSYFHHLVRLWDALSTAPARIDKRPLGDVISPWLVTDAALHMRARRRKEYNSPTTHRVLESTAMWLNFAIAWAFGVIVIGFLWWLSMPARSFGLTLSSAVSLFAMIFTGATSFLMLRRRMTSDDIQNPGHIFRVAPGLLAIVVLCVPLILISFTRTEGFTRLADVFPSLEPQKDRLAAFDMRLSALDPTGHILSLARLNLTGEQLVQRPQGWLPHAQAQEDYFAVWCKRQLASCKRADLSMAQEGAFIDDWTIRRGAARGDLQKPDWNSVVAPKPDLRDSIMPNAFLSGSHLVGAQIERADLSFAQMEGVELSFAQMEGADLSGAQMERADLSEAQMEGADLSGAQMERADLSEAQMERADLSGAQMEAVDLIFAQMERVNLSYAHIEGADLSEAQMQEAVLIGAQMEGALLLSAKMQRANLSGARMERADLSDANMEGAVLLSAHMEGANLSEALMQGTNLIDTHMEGVFLFGAQLERANLSFSNLTGTEEGKIILQFTNLSASTNEGGALRNVDMTEAVFDDRTDFQNAFMDGSVAMTDAFRRQLGDQCQSRLDTVLSDEQFYGRWLGWMRAGPSGISASSDPLPEEWRNVDPIAPDPGCEWKPPLAEIQDPTDAPDAGQN